MEKLYVAEFRYGNPCLAIVDVVKRNARTIQIANPENLIGRQFFSMRLYRVHGAYSLFDDYGSALEWLCKQADAYAIKCKDEFERAKEVSMELHVICDTLL